MGTTKATVGKSRTTGLPLIVALLFFTLHGGYAVGQPARPSPRRRSQEVEDLLARYYATGGFLPPPHMIPQQQQLKSLGERLTEARPLGNAAGDGQQALAVSSRDAELRAGDEAYRRRSEAAGGAFEIWAYDEVSEDAVSQAVLLTERATAKTPATVLDRVRAHGARIVIIGRQQRLTDMPPFRWLLTYQGAGGQGTNGDGRRWVDVRGAGAVAGNPAMAVGEEDLLETYDEVDTGDGWGNESVFMHELAHTIMDLGFDACQLQRVAQRYTAARESGVYTPSSYVMTNQHEYYAMVTAVSFDSTLNSAAADNLLRMDDLLARDPGTAELVAWGFGDTRWRYPDDCPTCATSWPWYYYDLYPPAPGTVPFTPVGACPVLRPGSGCGDRNATHCPFWASLGYCTDADNRAFMSASCMASCGMCPYLPAGRPPPPRPPPPPTPPPRGVCRDDYPGDCPYWSRLGGECAKPFMLQYCRVSCRYCSIASDGTISPPPPRRFPPRPPRPPPSPPPPPAPPPPTPRPSGLACRDRNASYCPEWIAAGYCRDAQYAAALASQCRFSCGFCRVGCDETEARCAGWAAAGECDNTPGYMEAYCAKSCGLCDGAGQTQSCGDDNVSCSYWAQTGECEKNPGYMLVSCRASCGVCSTQSGNAKPPPRRPPPSPPTPPDRRPPPRPKPPTPPKKKPARKPKSPKKNG
ncbi:hypothetical protein HYH02_006910 [Chlamydomonas schloesseri]|uniref:ShKT domain-containing protein n=1 Tax=Chlamydomonas schloesseri TaxID=2026947 RepID=A0A836B5K7_9CHLO|nr:hypothetical protein HYH02_006910 [Chlamydomonas schloesseri]|eukprot:KAG2448326.1 hypothetical protein HYH02_006910 [Chlamydomonas schloesseri]